MSSERADELTREEDETLFVIPELFCRLAASTVRADMKRDKKLKRATYWKGFLELRKTNVLLRDYNR